MDNAARPRHRARSYNNSCAFTALNLAVSEGERARVHSVVLSTINAGVILRSRTCHDCRYVFQNWYFRGAFIGLRMLLCECYILFASAVDRVVNFGVVCVCVFRG